MYTFKHMLLFDMIEPLDKMLPDFKSPALNVPSSNTAECRICNV